MTQRRLLGAGTLLVASLAAACGNVQTKERSQSPDLATRLLSDAANTAESVVSAVSESLGVPVTEPAPPTPAPVVEEPPIRRPRPAPVAKAPARAEEVAPVVADVVETPVADPAPPSIEEAVEDPEVVERLDYTVYSSADADVVPPTPPVASGIRPWRIKAGPSVEVTVGSDGTVEKVRVLGTTRMSDAMVLSHVKAWKFAPALRAGDPVRYRLLLDDPVVAP
jgi:outer membrane biosynthesis protein TonB